MMVRSIPRGFGLPLIVLFLFSLDALLCFLIRGSQAISLSPLNKNCEEFWTCVAFGCLMAQCFAVSLVTGWYGRSWLTGVIWGVALPILFVLSFQAVDRWSFDWFELFKERKFYVERSMISILGAFPAAVLISAAPLLVLRYAYGWMLTAAPIGSVRTTRFAIEDIAALSAVIAIAIMLVQDPSELLGPRKGPEAGASFRIVMIGLILLGANLSITLPISLIVLRVCRPRLWLIGMIGAAGLAWMGVLSAFFVGSSFPMILSSSNVGFVVATLIVIGLPATLLWLLRIFGYRIATDRESLAVPMQTDSTQVFEDDRSPDFQAGALAAYTVDWTRNLMRLQLLVLLIGGAYFGYLSYTKWARTVEDVSEKREAAIQSERRFGELYFVDGDVVRLEARPELNDEDLKLVGQMKKLKRLSLAGSRITDEGLQCLKGLNSLRELDLSHTAVTDACFETLKKMNVDVLKLNSTSTTVEGLFGYLSQAQLSGLEFGDHPLTDKDLKHLPNLGHIGLSKTLVTDVGVGEYRNRAYCRYIDLSYTSCDGSCLLDWLRGVVVNLDGTRLTQANFEKILSIDPEGLSIRETGVRLRRGGEYQDLSLRIGGGAIDEDNLIELGPVQFEKLSISDRRIVGRCLGTGKVFAPRLDLRGSGITDEELSRLIRESQIGAIDIRETDVSDQSLVAVRSKSGLILDIRGTKITAQGLLNSGLNDCMLTVTTDQFTPAETVELNKRFYLGFDSANRPFDHQWKREYW